MNDTDLTPIQGIRRELQRSIRRYIAGDAATPTTALAGEGWFGPDSMVWLIHSDWSIIVGGIESLVIQTLHPPTMAGVADHSDYRHDMLGRLHRTVDFLGATVFGSADDAERAVRIVRSIHDRVTGTLPDGTQYEANDPRNLGWVHATEVDGFLRSYRKYGAVDITDADADRYVAEMARVGEALGVERAPRSVAELDDTLRSYLPELAVGRQARDALRFILFPPHAPAARVPYATVLGAAVALLPNWARRKLWLPPSLGPIDDLVVGPPIQATLRALDWIMEVPEPIRQVRDAHARS